MTNFLAILFCVLALVGAWAALVRAYRKTQSHSVYRHPYYTDAQIRYMRENFKWVGSAGHAWILGEKTE